MKTNPHETSTHTNHAKEGPTMKTHTTSTTHANHGTKQEATMKTSAKKAAHASTETTPAQPASAAPEVVATTNPAASSSVPAQIQAIEQSCGYEDPLSDEDRRTSERLVQRVPSSIVEHVIALARRGGGSVAGIAFDPDSANAALAEADAADAVATAGQMLVRRAQDQAIRLRSGIAGDASAIRTALRGYVKTKQGASLASANDELRSLAKQELAARKGRKTRATKAAKTAPAATEPAAAASTAVQPTPPKAS